MIQTVQDTNFYTYNANWDELYLVTDGWKHELKLCKNDLQLLRNLMYKNLVRLLNGDHANHVQNILKEIANTIVQNQSIFNQIEEHLFKLERLVMSTFFIENQGLRNENKIIENNFYEFKKNYIKLKKEASYITELIELEKANQVLAV